MSLASGASHVYGVQTRAAAIDALNGLPAHSISKIYFVGHGASGAYFFSGQPVGASNFTANSSQLVQAPAPASFMTAVIRVLDISDVVEIGFLSCYTGGTSHHDLLGSIVQGLDAANVPRYTVGMFLNYYETRYTTDSNRRFRSWRDRVVSNDSTHSVLAEAPFTGGGVPSYERVLSTEADIESDDPLAGIEADL
jgi:hypothetical protein